MSTELQELLTGAFGNLDTTGADPSLHPDMVSRMTDDQLIVTALLNSHVVEEESEKKVFDVIQDDQNRVMSELKARGIDLDVSTLTLDMLPDLLPKAVQGYGKVGE